MKTLPFMALGVSFWMASPLWGEFNRGTGLVDIPKAEVLGANILSVQTNGFLAWEGKDSLASADLDLTISYGIGDRAEVGFSMYQTKSFAGSFAVKILEGKEGRPSLSFGIQEITDKKWISAVGSGEEGSEVTGFPDDLSYWNVANRNPERFSAYVAATMKISSQGSVTLGVGRGRFVGYGYRSRFFNTDFYIPEEDLSEKAHWDAVGLFMGGEWELSPVLFFMGDFDGRDINAGVQYRRPDFSVSVAWTHIEQSIGGGSVSPLYGPLNTRLAFGLEWNTSSVQKPPAMGEIAGRILDHRTQNPIQATISLPKAKIFAKLTDANGRFSLELKDGTYLVQVTSLGYETRTWQIPVKKGETTPFEVTLKRKELPEVTSAITMGYQYYSKGDFLAARSQWQRALQLDPGNGKAEEYLRMVQSKIQKQISIHRSKALRFTKAGSFKNARIEWRKVLNFDSSHSEAKKAIKNLNAKLKPKPKVKPKPKPKPKLAAKPKPKTKILTPEQIEAYYKAGVKFFLDNRFKQAISAFNKVLQSDPNHAKAQRYKKKAEVRLKALGG
ncbi:carboxypeptidase-like regulatory domain-containing protein [candidate division TA06 bacterium]|nr:carboxypeptidase-like regulatory domain-containing protein [candidate division TA06 bacterium]